MAFEENLLLRLILLLFITTLTLLPLPPTTSAQITPHSNISLGFSLTITTLQNSTLTSSPSGDFAFGFRQIEEDGFLLAIWFNNIPERTIVWYANGQNLATRGSKVELTSDGQFWLKDSNGLQMWNPNPNNNPAIHQAALLDTGNLVLVDNNSVIIWQSFSNPTDTILPGQVLSQESRLVSRYMEGNFSMGLYQFTLQKDGDLVLYTQNYPLDSANFDYWDTGVLGSNFTLVFNQSGYIFLQYSNGSIISMISSSNLSVKDFYQRGILEYDGVFRHYVYPKSNNSSGRWSKGWNVYSVTPSDICKAIYPKSGIGACGYNSYCTYDGRKGCHCPQGYSFVDPNDFMKGCKQDFASQSCDEAQDLFDLYGMQNTDWYYADLESFDSVTEDWCRQACLGDCFCAAVVFDGGSCSKKRQPLSNGITDSTISGKALMKIRKDNSTLNNPLTSTKSNSKLLVILIGSGSGLVLLLFLLVVAAAYWFGFWKKKSKVEEEPPQSTIGATLKSFKYQELSDATNDFSEELGRGGFATVYKGKISEDNCVAIKKLHSVSGGMDKEFEAEVSAIGQTNHRNLVQLIGYCNEGKNRLLVYEFLSNGSLGNFLFGLENKPRPRWSQRKEFALDIARGLSYLHNECRNQIIHCDIKPQNILLDSSNMARIADFGLAKLLKLEQTRKTNSGVQGTNGYIAPEWMRNDTISVKVDVYSYGIMLLELISCKKNFEKNEETGEILLDLGDGGSLLVKDDLEALHDKVVVQRYVMTALWCIQEDPSRRPTMKNVLLMLEGSMDVPIPPADDKTFLSFTVNFNFNNL